MASLTLFLALVLAVSGAHKVVGREALASVAARLCGAPESLGAVLLMGAAALEGLAAIALIIPQMSTLGGIVAAALWLVYCAALWRRRGEVLDCGCDLVRREKPVNALAIARPAVLAFLALGAAALPSGPWMIDAPFAALALLALWFAASELSALPTFSRTRS